MKWKGWGGEHARWRGRPKGGLYVYVYSLYSRENKWKKNKFIFLEKYFLNKYIDDPAQSIRWSSTFFLLFFFFFFLYPSPMLTHSLLPNNFPNDLEFMQLMTRSRLDRQTELYALSSCNSHSSWDRKQDHVFFLVMVILRKIVGTNQNISSFMTLNVIWYARLKSKITFK